MCTLDLVVLWDHESGKECIQRLVVVHSPDISNVLIWLKDQSASPSRVNTKHLIDLRMAFMVRLIIDEDLPIVPTINLITRPKDFREIEHVNAVPRSSVHQKCFDDRIVTCICRRVAARKRVAAAQERAQDPERLLLRW